MGLINSKLKCQESGEMQSITITDSGILGQNTARYYQEPYKVRLKLCRTGQTVFNSGAKIRVGPTKSKKAIWRMTRDGYKFQIYCEYKGRSLFLTPERTDGHLQLKGPDDSSKRYRDYEFYSDRHDNSGTKICHLATSKVLGTREKGRKLVLVLEEDSMGEYFNIEQVK